MAIKTHPTEEQARKTLLNENLKAFQPEQALQSRKILATSEKGKTYRVEMKPAKNCAVYQVDGDIITKGDKCDKLVLVETNADDNHWTEVFVELKGKDVGHAVVQLRESIKNPIFKHSSVKTKWARIVAQSIPKSNGNSVIERAKIEFKKNYHVELKAWSSGNTDVI